MAQIVKFDTADAVDNLEFTVNDNEYITLRASGFTGAEYLDILETTDDGASFHLSYQNGIPMRLSATNTSVGVVLPGLYALDKAGTIAAVRCVVEKRGFIG